MAKLIVFDLDGTLVDSRRDLADAANVLLEELGGAPLPVDEIAGMVGEGAALLVRRALHAAGVPRNDLDAALARFLTLYDERLLVHTRPYDGTREVLDALNRHAPLAVLTNKPQRPTVTILQGLELDRHFRWIIGGDTEYGRKPEPAGLKYLVASAGSGPDDTVLVGDSVIDVRTARAAGTRMCLVSYGFGFATVKAESTDGVLIADRPSDLLRLLT
jgi:phosphoglycolate phosphatase